MSYEAVMDVLQEILIELKLIRAGLPPPVLDGPEGSPEPAGVPVRAKYDPEDNAERKRALGLVCEWKDRDGTECGATVTEQQKRISQEYCGHSLCDLHEAKLRLARAKKSEVAR